MTEDEFRLLKIGDRVRPIEAENGLRRVYQLSSRLHGHANGTPLFRPVDLRASEGVRGLPRIFHAAEIERLPAPSNDMGRNVPDARRRPDRIAGEDRD